MRERSVVAVRPFDVSILVRQSFSLAIIGNEQTGKSTFIKSLRPYLLKKPIVFDGGIQQHDGFQKHPTDLLVVSFEHHSFLLEENGFDFIVFLKETSIVAMYFLYERWFKPLAISRSCFLYMMDRYTDKYGALILDVRNKTFFHIETIF